ncbi:sigma-70 family RNA polymerase sigma factor [Clostridium beijerinckii]|uniref:sigma-70 family RNA polymerase sigma factor n=1 Tax=Clostridium beijerinckii TaxID=1520 RepID=UPI0022E2BDB0|nr:sigma-70 family RNA polymerase sigma factor [Clostridium beijerinckii]
MDNNELAYYVEKLQMGNISAFEVIYNETNNQVYNLLYSYTKNQETSFDLMQETYLTVNSKIGTLKDPYAAKSWINRIAINKANRFFEKNKKEVLLSEEGQELFENQFEEDEEFLPQEILDSKEKQKIIKDIIDNLPLEQKTAVYLYYFDELSLSEIAEDMECSEGTIKSRLNYARKKIKVEVDTWEKNGTKLYGTGVPLLLLLLKDQLGNENIPLDKANALLKDIITNIVGNSSASTIFGVAKGNDKLANLVSAASKAVGKGLLIKASLIGGIAVISIGSFLFMNNKPAAVDVQKKVSVEDSSDKKAKDEIVIRYNKNDFERSEGNSVNNFYKKNQIALYNDKIYFNDASGTGLCSIGVDGNNAERLNDDKPSFINVYKDKLYYINTIDEKNNELICVSLDGKSNKIVIDKNVTSALVTNNKLVYIATGEMATGRISGYNFMNFIKVDLATNKKEISKSGYGGSYIIDENLYKSFSTSCWNYIGDLRKDSMIFPNDKNQWNYEMKFMGANDEFAIVQLSDPNGDKKPYSNKVLAINKNGQGDTNFLTDIDADIKGYILVGDEFYYYKENDLYCYNLKDKINKQLFKSAYADSDLFEFNGVIYAVGNPIVPIYDTKEKRVFENNITDNNIDEQNDDITAAEAKDLVSSEDKKHVDMCIKSGAVFVAKKAAPSEVKGIKNCWGIDEEGYSIYFTDPNEGKNNGSGELVLGTEDYMYYVGKKSKKVYKLPHEGVHSAYLIKGGNDVREFPWLGETYK